MMMMMTTMMIMIAANEAEDEAAACGGQTPLSQGGVLDALGEDINPIGGCPVSGGKS